MALSYYSGSEAPRDFQVSSTESEGHYTKCVLCYMVKKNFYCADCIRSGSFVHSSMPYSDRFSEKQSKLLRTRINRKHALERCERLFENKIKKEALLAETKRTKDRLHCLRLAIEQRNNHVTKRKQEMLEVKQDINELKTKLLRYQKRVTLLEKHVEVQRMELRNKINSYTEQAEALAALRRSRIRQLTKHIFPVYMTYDICDSIEDLEFVSGDAEEEPPNNVQLHIVVPWINTDGNCSHVQTWVSQNKQAALSVEPPENPALRTGAALGLAAQLVTLLAWILDTRLPHPIPLSEYSSWRVCGAARWAGRARRVCAGAGALAVRAALPPPAPPAPLSALHALAVAAATDDPALGRVESWPSSPVDEAWGGAWGGARGGAWGLQDDSEPERDEPEPPEHLHWPETAEIEEPSGSPPAVPPGMTTSIVSSAAASINFFWQRWTK